MTGMRVCSDSASDGQWRRGALAQVGEAGRCHLPIIARHCPRLREGRRVDEGKLLHVRVRTLERRTPFQGVGRPLEKPVSERRSRHSMSLANLKLFLP
jgi:hypothetical protein